MPDCEQLRMHLESNDKEDELMGMIDNVESAYIQKMHFLRNAAYIGQEDVEHFIKNIWLEKPKGNINYRYIWACWLEEQEEIMSNGW